MALLKVGIPQTFDFFKKAISALDETCKAVGVFLDLQKAFDCVNHTIIIVNRFYILKVRGRSLKWIKYFLILCLRLSKLKILNLASECPKTQILDRSSLFFIRIA